MIKDKRYSKQNQALKSRLYHAHIRNWKLASVIGWSEAKLTRKLRFKLSDTDLEAINKAIEQIKENSHHEIQS